MQEYCKLDLTHISECFDIKSEVKLKNPKSQSFFAKYGHICKSLDISFHHDYNSTVIAEILPCLANNLQEICLNGRANFLYEESSRDFLINAFPKLKCLFIYDSSFDLNGLEPRRIWAENVFHILAGSPSLEKIFYAPFLETRAKMFFEILNNLPIQHSNLSHLHINHLWTNAQETHSLLSKQYPLKYAHLVLTSHLPKVSLNQLLNSLKNTLRELTLTFTDGTSCLEFHPICPLEKITKLSLIGYDGPLLVSDAPVLKLFVMSLPDCNINAGNIMVNPDLEELEIYDFQAKYNPNYLKTLFRKFSKLKSLKINNVNNEILWAIYAYLPELEELKTCFHKFYGVATSRIDTGLNGLAGSQLDEELLDMWDDRGISHLRVNPWIGQLASKFFQYVFKNTFMLCYTRVTDLVCNLSKFVDLKHLTLEVGLMSDFGLILGISRCKNLIVLTLKNIGGNFENTNVRAAFRFLFRFYKRIAKLKIWFW